MTSRTNTDIGQVSVLVVKVIKSAHFCLLLVPESELPTDMAAGPY